MINKKDRKKIDKKTSADSATDTNSRGTSLLTTRQINVSHSCPAAWVHLDPMEM